MAGTDIFLHTTAPKDYKNTTNPVYILVARDETSDDGVRYYITNKKLEYKSTHVDLKGSFLSKQQVTKFLKAPSTEIPQSTEVNVEIPWLNIIKIINATYKLGEKTSGAKTKQTRKR